MPLPLFTLFLAAFAFGTAEFVIAGVLPDVALGLGVSVPVAGYLVTGYAAGIAIGGPLLAIATKTINRKTLVVTLALVFALGQCLCAMAPNFEVLLAVRIAVAVLHGTYFGIAFVVGTGTVPPERRGFAMAVILAGLTVSNVLGVPAGTAIGHALGWRATFWAVGGFAFVAALGLIFFLPAKAGASATVGSFRQEIRTIGRQQIFVGLLIAILVMIGQYSLFTYIAPLLTEVTRLDASALPPILLAYGVGSTIGVFIGGRMADWRLMPSVLIILSVQALLFAAVYFASPYALPMIILVLFWGGANFAIGSPLQSRMLLWAADAPNLTSTLIPAGFNVGIAIGAILGSSLLEAGMGYGSLPLIGTASVLMALVLALCSHFAENRSGRAPPLPMGATA
ncbi:MAG: MFS transporter [Devosia sp.]|uniref:MFS transporter n=1 Tax=Devosia sp. TaxID=1871048 RepID=UPI0024C61A2D|nr:MFS transporter [Devosia sp.]UYO00928.1 MAG: MFS transporter [Devosia sp.]